MIDSEKEGKGEESPYGYKWDIYLTYKTNNHGNEVKSKWFTSNDEFVQISVPSGKYFWIKPRIRMNFCTFAQVRSVSKPLFPAMIRNNLD